MGNVNMEASQINYRGGEKKMSVEEALKNTSGEAAAIAQLQEDVADLNDSKANKVDIATEFSDLTNYNAGDLVYYEGVLYEFQVDHTAGSWETSEVIQKDLSDIITTLKSGLIGVNYPLVDSVKGETITRLRGNVTKLSNVVTITGAWAGSATNEDVITIIPEGFRPSGAVAVMGSGTIDNAGTLAYAEYSVLPSGQLRQAQAVGAVRGGTFAFSYAI